MANILLQIIGISALLAIPTQSVLLSLDAERFYFRELVNRKDILFRYILTMFILTPMLAVAFFYIIGPSNGVWTAVFIISVTPASPGMVKNLTKLGGNHNISLTWMIMTMFLSLLFVPVNLLILQDYSDINIDLGIAEVFLKLMLMFILPMTLGFIISRFFSKYKPVIRKIFGIVSKIAMLVLVICVLIIAIPLVISKGIYPLLLILAFIIVALTIAHLMGNPEKIYGPVLPYSVIMRLPAPAIILAQINNTVDKHLSVIISFAILSTIVIIIYNKIFFNKKKDS